MFLRTSDTLGLAWAAPLVWCAAHWSGELQGSKNHSRGLDPYECFLELTPWELAKINPAFLSCNKQISCVTVEAKQTSRP